MPIATSQRTVIDCSDPGLLARFYGALLDWEVRVKDDRTWAGVWSRDEQHSLRFQRVAQYQAPSWPEGEPGQQMHIDLHVDDLDVAEAAVLALDPPPTKAAFQPGEAYRVFLDPSGHPFCLTTSR